MIHHVSIPAREPQHVAKVLAELMGGECHPFGPLDGAYMATSGDAHGTMIDVYPEQATLDIPDNDGPVLFGENKMRPHAWPFHMLLSVPLEQDEIERIGRVRAGAPKPSAEVPEEDRSHSSMSLNSGWKTG